MKICKSRDGGQVIIPRVITAYSHFERLKGLLGRSGLPEGEALHISPCGAIHTMGMSFTLDLLFLDKESCICKVAWNVPPARIVTGGFEARSVLEMEAGWFNKELVSVGKEILLEQE